MEFKIVIYRPGIVWAITIKAFKELIVGELSVYVRSSVDTVRKAKGEIYWCSITALVNDLEMVLDQIVTGNEIIETHVKCPRHAGERERRLKETLYRLLGITVR